MIQACIALIALQAVPTDVPPWPNKQWLEVFESAWVALDDWKPIAAHIGFDEAVRLAPTHATTAFFAACAAAQHGDSHAALGHLESAVELGYADSEVALWTPHLATLRHEPRFAELVSLMSSSALNSEVGLAEPPPARQHITYGSAKIGRVDCSPDGSSLAVPFSDGAVFLIDTKDGHTIRQFQAGDAIVREVLFGPRGKYLVATSSDKLTRVFEVESGDVVFTHETEKERWPYAPAAFTGNGNNLLLCSNWEAPVLINLPQQTLVWRLETEPSCRRAFINPGNDAVYARIKRPDGGADIRKIDLSTGQLSPTPTDPIDHGWRVFFRPKSTDLITSASGPVALAWNSEQATPFRKFSHVGSWVLESYEKFDYCAFNSAGSRLVTIASDTLVRCWDFETGCSLWRFSFYQGSPAVLYAAYSHDNSRVYFHGMVPGNALVVDAKSGVPVFNLACREFWQLGEVNSGKSFFGRRNHSIHLMDTDSGEPRFEWGRDETGEPITMRAQPRHLETLLEVAEYGYLVKECWPDAAILASQLLDPIRARAAAAGVPVRALESISLRVDTPRALWTSRTSHRRNGTPPQ